MVESAALVRKVCSPSGVAVPVNSFQDMILGAALKPVVHVYCTILGAVVGYGEVYGGICAFVYLRRAFVVVQIVIQDLRMTDSTKCEAIAKAIASVATVAVVSLRCSECCWIRFGVRGLKVRFRMAELSENFSLCGELDMK